MFQVEPLFTYVSPANMSLIDLVLLPDASKWQAISPSSHWDHLGIVCVLNVSTTGTI